MHGIHAHSRTHTSQPRVTAAGAVTAAPVKAAPATPPVDLAVLHDLATRWLRELRHGSASAVCWVCPRDAAGLVARIDGARVAGLL